jgi:hypothetical protein
MFEILDITGKADNAITASRDRVLAVGDPAKLLINDESAAALAKRRCASGD